MANTRLLKTNIDAECVSGGRIPITSGEQFVPVFLAFLNPETWVSRNIVVGNDHENKRINIPTSLPHVDFLGIGDNLKVKRQVLKEDFKKNLTSWGIKEYSLFMKLNPDLNNCYPPHNIEDTTFKALIDSGYALEYPIQVYSNSRIVAPFFLGRLNSPVYSFLKSPYTQLTINSYIKSITDIIPEVLMVVKAKHLNYIRAAIVFKSKIDLPISDIKLLRTPIINSWAVSLLSEIMPMLKDKELTIEYTTAEIIKSLLFKTNQSDNPEVVLRKAKQFQALPENEKTPIIFA